MTGPRRRRYLTLLMITLLGCTPAPVQPRRSTSAQPRQPRPEAAAVTAIDSERDEAARAAAPEATTAATDPAMDSAAPLPAAHPLKRKGEAAGRLEGSMALRGYGAAAGIGRGVAGGGRALRIAPTPPSVLPEHAVNTEAYAHRRDNSFVQVADAPLSTFSTDVDTASYSNVRRFLRDGQRPPADAVRVEELINYFRYAYPEPTGNEPFSVYTEVASAPWSPRHLLVQVGLRARDLERAAVPARNLVFLVDVSGSMQSADKLPLLQRGLGLLARQLREEDRLAIVVYAGSSGLVLPPTAGSDQRRILAALEGLQAGGSTNGAQGIELAYEVAQANFVRGGINRVVLATDGDFNVGVTSEGELTRLIERKRETGVFLTVLGFGTGNLKDATMEMLADKGNGNYAYIDSLGEAQKVLVREAGSTLVTVAKDVKLQVEWNPQRVASYRLIGYENRLLADRDFDDDTKDAGEIGAGHTVTALYEVTLTRDGEPSRSGTDRLKYQGPRAPTHAAAGPELLTIKVRYKQPDAAQSRLLSHAVVDSGRELEQTSEDFRWAAAVAGFGMLLRGSPERGNASYALVDSLARSAIGADASGDRGELIELIDRAARLARRADQRAAMR